MPVVVAAVTSSTNDDAGLWLRSASAAKAAMFAAGFQTQGRGRLQREWHARPQDALLCSLAWRFGQYPPDLPALSLVVALALVESLVDLNVDQQRLSIKWPNDVLLDGKKLAGILIEASLQQEQVSAVIGMGVNLSATPAQDLRYPAASVADSGVVLAPNVLLGVWGRRLSVMLETFADYGFEPFYEKFMRYDAVVGRPLQIEDEPLTVSGIDKTGALEVLQGGQLKRFVSGEVSLPWPCS
jgi:BirA family biotin operon repressor/biotin-[acetyl-CoA-carboxylase] ligase